MSPIHRDGGGERLAAPTWESLAERLIRAARERGEFDELPYRGERIPLEDDVAAGELALGFHVLRNAGAAPPWIEADKETRRLLAERAELLAAARRGGPLSRARRRADVAALDERVNAAVDRLNAEAPTPAQHRRRVDVAADVAALEQAWREADEAIAAGRSRGG